jgi:ABC-type glycerol-3-phosphate transport system substrate-binding protein
MVIIGVFCIGAFTVTGCSSNKSSKTEETKKVIKFATFYSDKEQGGIYKEIAKDFEKVNSNIKVEVTANFGNDEKIKEALSEKNEFDIIGIKRNQLIEYAKAGQLTDISNVIQENKLENKLYKISLAYGSYNSKQYGIGDLPIVNEWFYNVDLFNKNKFKEPVNLKELSVIAKKLKAKSIIPVSVGAIDGWTVSTLFGMITAQTTGTSELTDDYGTDMNTFKNIASMNNAFSIFNDLSNSSIPMNCDSINYRQSVEDFVNGKAAILPAGSFAVELIDKLKPAGFNYSIFSKGVQMANKPLSQYSASASEVLTIPLNSKNSKEASEFIKYLFSDEAQKKFTDKGYHSVLVSANSYKSDVDKIILNHLQNSDSNSIMLFDNLEPTMLESLTMVLKDSIQGIVKSKEAWNRTLKFTFQR